MAGRAADPRGRQADRPSGISRSGWLDVARRMWDDIGRYELSVVSAGIAFNEFFALFPALAAGVALFGLVADPMVVEEQVNALGGFLPDDVRRLIGEQLVGLTRASEGSLGVSFGIALVVALWGATRGVKGLMAGLNIVNGEEEGRGFLRYNLVALALTVGSILFGLVALGLVAALPAALGLLPLPDGVKTALSAGRWPVLGAFALAGLVVIYRYAPSRQPPRWRWVTWGAALAVLVWLAGSGLFSLYAARFGSFNETYGSVAAVAVMLLWFQLTAFAVLLGALLDAEAEHQTVRDSTTGPEQPMGRRGARMADTVGRARR
ncbi:YihY/virulence factor BrkB family protein [Magnetospirillum sp. UT-4]|uniref:YihY/virulence factor BrkB family protein n=1 Tax=Magnetospirillum sp. UT-4 TaxID=2681467 RepID=UPI0013845694